jgi:hypothetical protein
MLASLADNAVVAVASTGGRGSGENRSAKSLGHGAAKKTQVASGGWRRHRSSSPGDAVSGSCRGD